MPVQATRALLTVVKKYRDGMRYGGGIQEVRISTCIYIYRTQQESLWPPDHHLKLEEHCSLVVPYMSYHLTEILCILTVVAFENGTFCFQSNRVFDCQF